MTTASTYVQFNDGAQDFMFSVDFRYTCEKCLDPFATGDSPISYEVDVDLGSVTLQSDIEGVELLDFLDEATLERIEQECIEYAIEENR